MSTRTSTHIGVGVGPELVTGTDSNFDTAVGNNWGGASLGAFDIDTTVAGKLYMLGDGDTDRTNLNDILTEGLEYIVSLKARLNDGASTTIKVGSSVGESGESFAITPTGTETTFTGTFTADGTKLRIGLLNTGFNGIAFEIDDVSVRQIFP